MGLFGEHFHQQFHLFVRQVVELGVLRMGMFFMDGDGVSICFVHSSGGSEKFGDPFPVRDTVKDTIQGWTGTLNLEMGGMTARTVCFENGHGFLSGFGVHVCGAIGGATSENRGGLKTGVIRCHLKGNEASHSQEQESRYGVKQPYSKKSEGPQWAPPMYGTSAET